MSVQISIQVEMSSRAEIRQCGICNVLKFLVFFFAAYFVLCFYALQCNGFVLTFWRNLLLLLQIEFGLGGRRTLRVGPKQIIVHCVNTHRIIFSVILLYTGVQRQMYSLFDCDVVTSIVCHSTSTSIFAQIKFNNQYVYLTNTQKEQVCHVFCMGGKRGLML